MSSDSKGSNQAIKLIDWDPTERKVVVMLRDQEVVVRRLTDKELESPIRLRDDYYKRESLKFWEESIPSIKEGDEDRLVFMRTALACYILNWYFGPHFGDFDPFKGSWNIYVDYKGYTHQISDRSGWEIQIDIISITEPPQDIVKELREIIAYLISHEGERHLRAVITALA